MTFHFQYQVKGPFWIFPKISRTLLYLFPTKNKHFYKAYM
jgi:hypothetical protein